MIVQIKTAALSGLDGAMVVVEADFANGLPSFEVVGLGDAAVRESKERVRAAVRNSGFEFPAKRAVINLAPADLKKEGTQFDLPIAIAVLAGTGQLEGSFSDCLLLGELGLSGELRPVSGVLPAMLTARERGITRAIVPMDNAREAALAEGIAVYGARCLADVYLHLRGEVLLDAVQCDLMEVFQEECVYDVDFSEVKGQSAVKRGIEIAAAGGHNCCIIGSPGSGKSMLAQRIPTILPDLTPEEALEVTKIHSIAGELRDGACLVARRPFRSPHHNASAASMVGGGAKARPGEVSLAHRGVLFLDEFPEYHKDVLEALRQPLEDGTVTVTRAAATYTYPCRVMLIAAMNPCRCGYYGDPSGKCHCSPADVARYLKKISGPVMDRIDIQLEAPTVPYSALQSPEGESSADIRARVNRARRIQAERYRDEPILCNAQLSGRMIETYCALGEEAEKLLQQAFEGMRLSARAYTRILKVARTIADLEGRAEIASYDIAEAISYRSLDRKYWG